LATYNQMDIALDPWPFNGGTTTCDALWMGVPVVTLTGDKGVSRVGRSVLTCIGLPDLVANDADTYISIAANLARDPERLATLRRELRDRLRQSPLTDAPRLTKNIEHAYRQIWRTWCATS
jgi:predicted O-linked N-acetylglucosamine transferase (SPINDLY family)